MGAFAVAMPRLGMTMQEGRVVEWPLALGAFVEKGRTVLVIESEKAEVEVEATASGYLRHVYVEPGETVPCGTLLAALTPEAGEAFDAEAFRGAYHRGGPPRAEAPARDAPAPGAGAARVAGVAGTPAWGAGNAPGRAPVTPAARRRARELGIDVASLRGSGPGGRVTVEDVEGAAAGGSSRVSVADGVSLECPRLGRGEPVLLLPGFGTDVSVFARQVPALAERFETIGVNPRGVGASEAPGDGALTVTQAAADAAAVAAAPAHVVGTSLGAAVALELALSHPERVRSLALLAPVCRVEPRLLAVTDAWCRLAAETSSETLAAALLPWFFAPASLADERARERLLRGLAATLARVPAAVLARAAAGLRAYRPPRERLAELALPVLVVAGGADLLTPGGDALAAAIPGARGRLLPEAGHALQLEAPDAVNAALREHLESAS